MPVVEQPPRAENKQNEEETTLTDKLPAQAYPMALQNCLVESPETNESNRSSSDEDMQILVKTVAECLEKKHSH